MTDGMVAVLRHTLDQAGFFHIPILSYSVKYCSSLYGPFREAAQGAPNLAIEKPIKWILQIAMKRCVKRV